MKEISKKVIIIGNFMVGKSSIVDRFVNNKFSEIYLTTLGVRVDKKVVDLEEATVNMIIWDIAGEVSQMQGPASYYLGSHGVIYVFDLTRESTYSHVPEDLEVVHSRLPGVPVVVMGNKLDLISEEEFADIKSKLPFQPDFFGSAKTGLSIEPLFEAMARKMT
jgi:small GTP-binding protein